MIVCTEKISQYNTKTHNEHATRSACSHNRPIIGAGPVANRLGLLSLVPEFVVSVVLDSRCSAWW